MHDRFGGKGILFKTLQGNVRWDGTTLHATGSLVLPTGNGDGISLLEAEVQEIQFLEKLDDSEFKK